VIDHGAAKSCTIIFKPFRACDSAMIVTFAILSVAILLFLSERLRPDMIALLVMLGLGLGGVLDSDETFSGFSRSAVIAIIAIFVLADALRRTGATEKLGAMLIRFGGQRESRLVFTVTLAGAVLSLFMNNIAAASVLLPAISGAARKASISPSRLLMPLAFGTILGGMATLLTTANIVVSGILREHGMDGFRLLDFATVGVPVVVAGTAYMSLVGRRLLPAEAHPERILVPRSGSLQGVYGLDERLIHARICSDSPLAGVQLSHSNLREKYKLNVVSVQRGPRIYETFSPDLMLKAGDVLHMIGRIDQIPLPELTSVVDLLTLPQTGLPELGLVEVVLTPRSQLIGKTLREAHFREKYHMNVLAIWRAGRAYRTGHADLPLAFGDALLLHGLAEHIPALRTDPELVVLSDQTIPVDRRKALRAAIIMLGTLTLAAFTPIPTGEVMLGGALIMVMVGVLDMDQAYRAIEWKSALLVAGMLPLGTALIKTGAAELLATTLVGTFGQVGIWVLVTALLILTTALTQVLNGPAVAALMAPIGIQVAQMMGIDPRAVAMGIAMATSVAFATPLGHPVNILVMGPGGYRFRDYLKVGLPLTLVVFLVLMVCLPLFWPLG
jgi:di/tricarboxylate transporter